jgi:hypothetical protein
VNGEAFRFRRALSSESDRGAALFAAAHIDSRLEVLLRAFLVQDEKVAAPLFRGTAAPATFSARIDMAYLLGLLSSEKRNELHLIRKMRNEFAHSASELSFSHEPLASQCRQLTHVAVAKNPRARYIQAVMSIAGTIDGTIRLLKENKIQALTPRAHATPSVQDIGPEVIALFANALQRSLGTDPRTSDEPVPQPSEAAAAAQATEVTTGDATKTSEAKESTATPPASESESDDAGG